MNAEERFLRPTDIDMVLCSKSRYPRQVSGQKQREQPSTAGALDLTSGE